MIHPRTPVIVRLRVQPGETAQETAKGPPAIVGSRPSGSRAPHADARTAEVRRLIEQTTLTYSQIALRTGVGRASICRWTRRGGVELDLIPQPVLDLLIDAHTPPEDHPALRPRGSRRG